MNIVFPSLAVLLLIGGELQAQTPPQTPPPPTGVTQLPLGPPPTGLQAPVPSPSLPLPRPDRPAATSPGLKELGALLSRRPLTINDAVAIALATNRNLALAVEALARAQGRTAEMRSAFNPVIGTNLGEVYVNHDPQAAGSIVGTLPLDISGLIRAASDQAQFQEVAARLDVNRTRNQIVADVKSAFYGVLRAKALVAVATENLQNSLDRLKDANLKYQVQAVAYYDLVRAQTDVANAQKQVIQARNAVSLSLSTLNGVMGIEVTTPLQLSDVGAVEQPPGVAPPPPAPPANAGPAAGPGAMQPVPPPAAIDLKSADLTAPTAQSVIDDALKLGPEFPPLLQEALGERPELFEADASIAAARKGIVIARRSELPQLSLNVGYFDIRNSTGTRHIDEPQALLGVTIPIFDGGLARARRKEAEEDVATAITNKRQIVDAVTQDVQQAYLNLIQARDQVAVANQALAQAREAFNLARTRYNAGVASHAGISPLLEFSDAQAALTLAESNQVNALYDYNQSRAQLDRAIGRYAFTRLGPGYNSVPPPKTVGGH